jgi:hypothetical protein
MLHEPFPKNEAALVGFRFFAAAFVEEDEADDDVPEDGSDDDEAGTPPEFREGTFPGGATRTWRAPLKIPYSSRAGREGWPGQSASRKGARQTKRWSLTSLQCIAEPRLCW